MVIESNQEIISQIKDLLHGEKISQKEIGNYTTGIKWLNAKEEFFI